VLEAFEDDGIAWEKLKVHRREFERNVLPFERTSKRVRERRSSRAVGRRGRVERVSEPEVE
jgi:hypothetical protein